MAGCTSLPSRHPGTRLKSQTSRSDLNWGYLLRHQFNMELLLCFYCNDQLRISTSETSGGWFTGSRHGPCRAAPLERPAPAALCQGHLSPWCCQGSAVLGCPALIPPRCQGWIVSRGVARSLGKHECSPAFHTAPPQSHAACPALLERPVLRGAGTHRLFFWVSLKQIFI